MTTGQITATTTKLYGVHTQGHCTVSTSFHFRNVDVLDLAVVLLVVARFEYVLLFLLIRTLTVYPWGSVLKCGTRRMLLWRESHVVYRKWEMRKGWRWSLTLRHKQIWNNTTYTIDMLILKILITFFPLNSMSISCVSWIQCVKCWLIFQTSFIVQKGRWCIFVSIKNGIDESSSMFIRKANLSQKQF